VARLANTTRGVTKMNYFRYCQDAQIANRWFDLDDGWLDLATEHFKFNDFMG